MLDLLRMKLYFYLIIIHWSSIKEKIEIKAIECRIVIEFEKIEEIRRNILIDICQINHFFYRFTRSMKSILIEFKELFIWFLPSGVVQI